MSVRIIDKEETYKIGQKGCGIQVRILAGVFLGLCIPRFSLGFSNFTNSWVSCLTFRRKEVPSFLSSISFQMARQKPYTWSAKASLPQINLTYVASLPTGLGLTLGNCPQNDPILLGQDRHEEVLREHLAKYECEVELGTELVSFEQSADRVVSRVLKTRDGQTVEETIESRWLIGSEGARSVVRKTLGLTFLGETRESENIVVGDIKIIKPQLDEVSSQSTRAFHPFRQIMGSFGIITEI